MPDIAPLSTKRLYCNSTFKSESRIATPAETASPQSLRERSGDCTFAQVITGAGISMTQHRAAGFGGTPLAQSQERVFRNGSNSPRVTYPRVRIEDVFRPIGGLSVNWKGHFIRSVSADHRQARKHAESLPNIAAL
jgi:hypothetical protein